MWPRNGLLVPTYSRSNAESDRVLVDLCTHLKSLFEGCSGDVRQWMERHPFDAHEYRPIYLDAPEFPIDLSDLDEALPDN